MRLVELIVHEDQGGNGMGLRSLGKHSHTELIATGGEIYIYLFSGHKEMHISPPHAIPKVTWD